MNNQQVYADNIFNQQHNITICFSKASMAKVEAITCERHCLKITHVCRLVGCKSPMEVCQQCLSNHINHKDHLSPFDDFVNDLTQDLERLLENSNSYSNIVTKIMNQIQNSFSQYCYRSQRVKKLLKQIFKEEAQTIYKAMVQYYSSQLELKQIRLINYFQVLCSKNLFKDRIMLSSQEGLKKLNEDYEQLQYFHKLKQNSRKEKVEKGKEVEKVDKIIIENQVKPKIYESNKDMLSQWVNMYVSTTKKKSQESQSSRSSQASAT